MSVVSDNLLRQIIALLGGTPPDDDGTPESNSRVEVIPAAIVNGASLSDAIDLEGGRLAAVLMPAGWTSAALSFQGSADGVTYADLFDGAAERQIPAASMALMVGKLDMMNPDEWDGLTHIKLRSGLTGAAANQGSARTFSLVVQKGL